MNVNEMWKMCKNGQENPLNVNVFKYTYYIYILNKINV